jgi:Mg-chelatase subunit ChlD
VGANGYEGPRDLSQESGSVVAGIESMQIHVSRVWTNTADGINQGIDVLSVDNGGRPYALKFMILMTDGVPNRWPGNQCHQDDLWPHPHDPPDAQIDKAKDCVIYYAQQAKAKNIAIFTVGLGLTAQREEALLMEIADLTDGEYFYAQTAGELEQKLQQIADRIFLRLVD